LIQNSRDADAYFTMLKHNEYYQIKQTAAFKNKTNY